MKYFLLLSACIVIVHTENITAKTHEKELYKSSVGYNIGQFQKDFGLGIDFTTPYFLNRILTIRLSANIQWLEHVSPISEETCWSPYGNIRLGIRSRQFIVEKKISIYGEGGVTTIIPNSTFSGKKINWGGYGLFGFEFNPSVKNGIFLEAGGIGTGSKADAIPQKPIYNNGFIMNAGFRYYL